MKGKRWQSHSSRNGKTDVFKRKYSGDRNPEYNGLNKGRETPNSSTDPP